MLPIETVLHEVKEYSSKYRHPSLPQFIVSELYDLFPDPSCSDLLKWPHPYPQAENQGVYLIMSEQKSVLYIGKASMNNTLGSRISSYFSYTQDKKACQVKSLDWSEKPRFICTIAVPDKMSFEAPALEEYLIKKFSRELSDNTIGAFKL